MGGGGGRESDYSVCPRPLLQFLQSFQFMSDRLHQVTQVTSGYVSLLWRDGTWSSTIPENPSTLVRRNKVVRLQKIMIK